MAWLGHTRPDISAVANMARQITESTFEPKNRLLKDCIKDVEATPKRGLL